MNVSNCLSQPANDRPNQFVLHHNRNVNQNQSYQSQGYQNQGYQAYNNANHSFQSTGYQSQYEGLPNFYCNSLFNSAP